VRVVYAIDSLISGGAQRQVVELALALQKEADVSVQVLFYRDADFFGERLRKARIPLVHIPKLIKVDPTLPLRMRRWFDEQAPDVVHAFLLGPALWSLLAVRGIPAPRRPVFIAAERSSFIATSLLQRRLQCFVYGRSDAVTANAESVAETIHERLDVPRDNIRYIPNGIDLATWDRAAAGDPPWILEGGRFHMALIGRLQPGKNQALLVDALSRIGREAVADWRVWLIGAETGRGRYAAKLGERIRRLGLEKTVRVVPPTRDIPALMGRLDLLVLTSRAEAFPNVVLEAMASGIPVIATPVGDVPNLVANGETGILCSPTDPEELAQALVRIRALTPDRRSKMGRRAREIVEQRYRIEAVASSTLEFYRQILSRRSGNTGSGKPSERHR
jgi:glycosyltransferase involved in cell wall biosynthesis